MTGGAAQGCAGPDMAAWGASLTGCARCMCCWMRAGISSMPVRPCGNCDPVRRWRGRFLDRFDLRRPRAVMSMADLMASSGVKLHLRFRDPPATGLKGVLMPLPGGQGAIVNLSFGISILDAVRDYRLTSGDFAATDLAIEMLYLVEAKSAAMEASRLLNQRLQGARIAAEEQAFTDTLTGLKNRRAMDHVLGRVIATQMPFAVMHVDLDFFKAVNDRLGHAAGDHVLQEVARIMIDATRRGKDTVARTGATSS